MSTKYERISELYADICKAVVSSPERWQDFLKSACRNYKLRFDELLLIYAQRPDATAVLEIEQWNKFGRYVKRGSNGIAVFEDAKRTNQRLVHYFDISDTGSSKYARPVPIWKMKEEYENRVIETFEKRFGVLENNMTLPDAVVSTVTKTVEESILNYRKTLIRESKNSFLSDFDETAITSVYRNIVSNSVAFLVMTRLDIDTSKYFDDEDFREITSFNTVETLNAIGLATGEVSQKLLTSAAKTIISLEKSNKIIDNENTNKYNKVEKINNNTANIITEGSLTNERNPIQTGRGLFSSGFDASGTAGSEFGQIRRDEEKVSERTPQNSLHQSFDKRRTDSSSGGNRGASFGDGGNSYEPDESAGRFDGRTENERHDGMGSRNEQSEEQSSGNSESRGDLRLELEWYDRKNEDKSLPFFGNDDTIREILRTTPYLSVSKEEIKNFYKRNSDDEVRTEFIKENFNNDYTQLTLSDGRRVGYKTYQNVLHLWEGEYSSRTSQGFYDWGVIAGYFEAMQLLGELEDTIKYLPSVDEQMSLLEKTEVSNPVFSFSQEIIDRVLTRGSGVSEGKMRIYEQYKKSLSSKENIDFLKNEYGWGGSYPIIIGTNIDEMHDMKGIHLSKGFDSDKQQITLSWKQVEKRIGELIKLDRYLNPKETEKYPEWIKRQEEKRAELAVQRKNREILATAPPESEKHYEYHLGDKVYISSSEYEILSFDENRVMLYDTASPLFNREMTRSDFDRLVSENPMNEHLQVKEKSEPVPENTEEPEIQPSEELKPEQTALNPPVSMSKSPVLRPDIPISERHNFNLNENEVEYVGKKERFRRNIMAIQLLKKCQEENRFATPEEQVILSKYVGWGGIPEAFDERNSAWATEYLELSTVLTPEEYSAARESTLTAFYTPPEVINAVYSAIENMGFKQGNILEPSCGIGNFIGMLPDSMKDSKIYGVELDKISGSIAQQLYQKHSIAVQGFEETNLPDSFFDVAVGNVPFGDFKVIDKRYDKHKFLIHDYFFAKTLDKLRPGGVMAFITSKGTMDKENNLVRKYIAQRAELLGAIRLPNDTFKGNAGTEVVSDILFLKKRDRILDLSPDWVDLAVNDDGIKMNSYFVQNPEMILGEMKMVSGRFGMEATCEPIDGADLKAQLAEAVSKINGTITAYEQNEIEEETEYIIADPTVTNFSYAIIDGKLYFREDSIMNPCKVPLKVETRIRELITLRDTLKNVIHLQMENYPDIDIKQEQQKLNTLYDSFTEKYGLINSKANISAFSQDSSFFLLSALESINDEGKLERKADIFYKRTIKPHQAVTSVDTASEALALSMGEKAAVDMEYMSQLTGMTEQEIFAELKGVIFLNPMHGYGSNTQAKYLTADEYLSGNVREKLAWAKRSAQLSPDDFQVNVEALEKVQPKDLTASEISVRLGATWLPSEIVQQFVFELLQTPRYSQWNMKVNFSQYTGKWNISGKSADRNNIRAEQKYGTSRINAYYIIEETLNLKDVRIFDYEETPDGKKKAVLNKKETAIAQSKQELIKQEFQDWIWKDPVRREKLTKMYNEKFNSIRPREYDGSHIIFSGINPEIKLREHQRNAVAHILYGGNTLLAHVVGAGKTFEMVAAAQENKRLGLCQKSLFVVPNHLTEQWASEYLQLYPAANILVATKKDFETKNRKRFCGRIATGDYDAVIIGHSQFEKIPMSIGRQRAFLEEQLDDITQGIDELKRNRGDSFSVKELERTRKAVKQKLDKLNDQSRKDDVVTFEELGVDRIFIDESHYYKNLFLYTKMRNVGGIAQTEAQKSSDLFMKCRYLDELTGGRGVVFATGTPISNSMVELYTIQRYLQYGKLQQNGLQHFDAWASTFGETVTATELTPEGTGYRMKTRFSRFYNLPELMAMFKEAADIKTADMLNLPVPKANFHNVAVKPSEIQKEMVLSLSERAEKVRNGMVDSKDDNMLKITNDGRKLALDQRMINPMLPDFEGSKLNACVDNIHRIWTETADKKSTQLVFCDLSTPKKDGSFNTYDDIRGKLIKRGIPKEEIRFIHEADTEAKKQELFRKVRKGEVRILIGSTQKMGAGTNVQDKLIALHDLDCPWRPSDVGRILRTFKIKKNVEVTDNGKIII